MTTPTAPDLDDLDPELARLLTDRAGAIEPRGTTPAHLARRASRIRHRRRATAAGVGLAAAAVVSAVVVTRPSDDSQRVETSVADDALPGTTAVPDGRLVYPPIIPTTVPPAPGPVPRLGLDVDGAVVTSAGDFGGGGGPAQALSTGVRVDFVGPIEDRWIRVMTIFPNGMSMAEDLSKYDDPPPEDVDLGGGVIGKLSRSKRPPNEYPVTPGYPMPDRVVAFEVDGARLHVSSEGLTEDELIRVARGIEIADPQALVAGWVPDDLTPTEPSNPIMGGASGPSSSVAYDLPDGMSVFVKVSSAGGDIFDQDLELTRAEPSEFQFLRTVRGADAIVRKAPGTTSVLWREPRGHLVEVYIRPAGANFDPSVIADESIVDAIVELDEATFQELVVAHPVVTGPVPQPHD